MKLQEAIHILTLHQAWRLGTDIPMAEPKQLSEAIHVILNHHMVDETQTTSSQTEISDEMSKIEKALYHTWSDYEYKEGNLYSTTFRDGWLMGIDWYKKQLNNK